MDLASSEAPAAGVHHPIDPGTTSIEVLPPRQSRIGLGLLFRAPPRKQVYRLQPLRRPEQPRFWCVVVYPCTRNGTRDPDGWVWVGPDALSRDELSAAVAAIRANPNEWVAQAVQRALRQRLLADAQIGGREG